MAEIRSRREGEVWDIINVSTADLEELYFLLREDVEDRCPTLWKVVERWFRGSR